MFVRGLCFCLLLPVFHLTPGIAPALADFEEVRLVVKEARGERAAIESEVSFFAADGANAIVFVHQSGSDKESWHPLAEYFQARDVASVALEGILAEDVWAGVDFLKDEGYSDIVLIGASLGGGGILRALQRRQDDAIAKVVLLAPGPGPALEDAGVDKLVIVAEQDFYADRAHDAFEEAAEPKTLQLYPGTEHAQALLEGAYKDDVIRRITSFMQVPNGWP